MPAIFQSVAAEDPQVVRQRDRGFIGIDVDNHLTGGRVLRGLDYDREVAVGIGDRGHGRYLSLQIRTPETVVEPKPATRWRISVRVRLPALSGM